jgi:hypothetical protein
MSITITLC